MSAAPRAAAAPARPGPATPGPAMGGGRIAELPPAVADAIAAGEVIERPASAIKELLENACDAGARRIEVEVEGAGLSRIRVRDDGLGMTPAELPIAFRRHATSKLRGLEDLSALHSYGFRGEALPSLAAVAALECTSRPAAERLGARLRIGAGIEPDARPGTEPVGAPPGTEPVGAPPGTEPVGAPPGTTIELRDLFARQPARLRFLPGPRSERAAIARVCGDTALARPEIALRLRLDGRELLATPGLPPERHDEAARTGSRRAALAQIWGPETAAAALPFAAERELEAGGVLRVSGLAAPPPHGRARRDGLRLFVNGRPITPGALAHAVEGAYAELLPRGRRPLAAVFVEAPPSRVDANVHPAKATVKLADERALFSLLQRALRETLLGRPALGGRAPGGAEEAMPGGAAQVARPPDFLRRDPAGPDGDGPDGRWRRLQRLRALGGETPQAETGAAPDAAQPDWPNPNRPQPDWPPLDPAGPDPTGPGPAAGRERGLPGLPLLRLVGQLRATFLVAEGPEGMLLVDQHAAHERVVYERLLARRGAAPSEQGASQQQAPEQQALLEPVLVELGAAQAAALAGHDAALAALGFTLEPFGERALRVRALPLALLGGGPLAGATGAGAGARVRAALESILDDLGDPDAVRGGRHDPVAASAACHGSVRAGMTLAPSEMAALLRDLEACHNPHTCPHGRPTFVGFPAADLERQFGRR